MADCQSLSCITSNRTVRSKRNRIEQCNVQNVCASKPWKRDWYAITYKHKHQRRTDNFWGGVKINYHNEEKCGKRHDISPIIANKRSSDFNIRNEELKQIFNIHTRSPFNQAYVSAFTILLFTPTQKN